MIFLEGFSSSAMKINDPFPLLAQPRIRLYEAPFPIPMVCTREYLLFKATILTTPVVFITAPSVSKKICLA